MKSYLSALLKSGQIAVIPTDTIYGLVASAFDKKAVSRLYRLKKRTPTKPFIILIDKISRLKNFGIILSPKQKTALKKFWPGKVSIILPLSSCHFPSANWRSGNSTKNLHYLHRGANSLAFRLPKNKWLLSLLKKTGPLVAPSANPEGLPPSKTIKEAENYFGSGVNLFIDGGKIFTSPSRLLSLSEDGKITILRK